MVKPGGRPGLAERALVAEPLLGLRRHRRQRDLLDGDVAVQQFIASLPDNAHGTAAELLKQPVASGHKVARTPGGMHGVQSTRAGLQISVSLMGNPENSPSQSQANAPDWSSPARPARRRADRG